MRNEEELDAIALKAAISSLGNEYIEYISGEIEKLEKRQRELSRLNVVQELRANAESIASLKMCLEHAKLIIAASSEKEKKEKKEKKGRSK